MMGILGISVVLTGVALVGCQVPIPKRIPGYVYKNVAPTASVHIEFFLDLLCPYCKEAFPTLKAVGDHYGNSVLIAAVPFPLPYHRNAFLAAKGIHVVKNITGGDLTKIYDWMSNVFIKQDDFGEDLNYNVPEHDTVGLYASIASNMGFPPTTFTQLLVNSSDLDFNTRVEWKYACSRGVSGTPWFTVNGVTLSAAPSWSLKEWMQVIDPLLAESHTFSKRSFGEDCKPGTTRCEYLPGKVECCTSGENCVPNVGCRC